MKGSPGGHRLDGFGVAVPARKAVTSGISKRTIRLALTAAGSVAVALALTGLVSLRGPGEIEPPPRSLAPPEISETPGRLRSYALSLGELDGLPARLSSGTELQIWVAWEPPVTRAAQVQLLVERATLDRIVANVVPGEPPTVLLLVSPKDVPDLLYGDRWGALSAVVVDH